MKWIYFYFRRTKCNKTTNGHKKEHTWASKGVRLISFLPKLYIY